MATYTILRHDGSIVCTAEDISLLALVEKQKANLRNADLRNANLGGARNVSQLTLAQISIVPEVGVFEGWKRCSGGVIVHLRIPADAKRSSAGGRKCRAEMVEVLAVHHGEYGVSIHDGSTEYRTGSVVRCDTWDENPLNECSGGIHFYLSRIEAEHHS